MAEKTLNTRIQLKTDNYSEWNKQGELFIPKKGEACVVIVPAETGAVTTEPAFLLKVGNGTSKYRELPFVSALAADVYAWAKKDKLAYSDLPQELQSEIDNLQSAIGSSSVTEAIQSAINALDKSDSAVPGQFVTAVSEQNGIITVTRGALQASDIPTLTIDKITGLQDLLDNKVENSVIEEMVLGQVTVNPGYMIESISQTAGKVSVNTRQITEADIPAISQEKVKGLSSALNAKQDTLVFENSNYDPESNKAITKADLDSAVGGLSGAMHFRGSIVSLPANTTGYNSGDVIIVTGGANAGKEYVCNGAEWVELGDETRYAVKGNIVNADISESAAIAQSKIANLVQDLQSKATAQDITDKINTLNFSDTEVSKQFITEVQQANGVVSVKRRALVENDIPNLSTSKVSGLDTTLSGKAETTYVDSKVGQLEGSLAEIAKTGNIQDLIQSPEDVIIFNCGTATTVI